MNHEIMEQKDGCLYIVTTQMCKMKIATQSFIKIEHGQTSSKGENVSIKKS